MRFLISVALALVLAAPTQAQGSAFVDEETYFEGHEVGSFIFAELSAVHEGMVYSQSVVQVEPDGYFSARDALTAELIFHGLILEDGSVQSRPNNKPRPPRGAPRSGVSRRFGVCVVGEELAARRCARLCAESGVKSSGGGLCGVGGTCECHSPPVREEPKSPVPDNGFVPIWMTIPGVLNPDSSCGMLQICDDFDPL
jgi:hypothetical protein